MMDYKEHTAYKSAFELSNKIWKIVSEWEKFAQFTIGNQLVRAIDSISANIAEGWYKNTKNHRVKYYRIAHSSLAESQDWTTKAHERKLINKETFNSLIAQEEALSKDINGLIKGTLQMLQY